MYYIRKILKTQVKINKNYIAKSLFMWYINHISKRRATYEEDYFNIIGFVNNNVVLLYVCIRAYAR